MKYLFFLIVTSALFISCTKGSDNNNVTMTYGQTQCSDKWGYGANDDETKTKLTQFLDSLRISYTDVKFAKTNPAAVCLACICVTGGVFTLKTTEAYVNQLKDLGFTRQ